MNDYKKLLRYLFSIGVVFLFIRFSFQIIGFRPLAFLARIDLIPGVLSSIIIGGSIAYVAEKMGKRKAILLLCLLPFYYFYSFIFSAFLSLAISGSLADFNYSWGFNQTFWPELFAITLLILLFTATANKLKLFIPINVALFLISLVGFSFLWTPL